MRLPDFIIAGAPRSGTTWLYQILDRHPNLFLAKPVKPEPKFFLVDSIYEKGISYYSKTWFSEAPTGKLCGEKTTNYLENPIVAERMHSHIPNVKLIFLLRDPVDRAYSNYLWSRMNGLETERFEDAIELEASRETLMREKYPFARPFDYINRGKYVLHLQPFFNYFQAHNIRCFPFEWIGNNPQKMADSVCEFLEIDRMENAGSLGVVNAAEPGEEMSQGIRLHLQDIFTKSNAHLKNLLGPTFELWNYER